MFSRWFDGYSTYNHTPDLTKEANPLVSIFGFGWTPLLIVYILAVAYVIYTYLVANFNTYDLMPSEKGYSFSHCIGYIYTGTTQPWGVLFYKYPKKLIRLHHYVGHLVTRCLVFAGFISTIMWLLI